MARTVRDVNLETRTARSRLKAAGKPYYRAIDEGLHIGYRKGKTGGKWVMRAYVGRQTYQVETIGTADDTLDPDGSAILNFHQAQALARTRFVEQRRVNAGLPAKNGPFTVKACVEDYLDWLDEHRKSGADARYRAEALIFPILGEVACAKLSSRQIRDWLETVANTPARRRTKRGEEQEFKNTDGADPEETKRKRRASANRTLTILKAALNHAWRAHRISSDDAWRMVQPYAQADAARLRYLTIAEAKRLINAAAPDFRRLVQAALLTGARYGELCALNSVDYNPDSGTLHIRSSKSGKGRHVVLTDEGQKFFRSLTIGKVGSAILIPKADGSRWLASHQARPMDEACKRGKISPPANFHALRHTYASHSVMNGAPLLVVAKNLGHTDTRMVEKHYGHLADSFIADAIRASAPNFGIKSDKKVSAL